MKCDWIAVDWGTSNLRIWAMCNDGAVIAEKFSTEGVAHIRKNQFEAVLLSHIEPWIAGMDSVRVVACGMVGSRQGWEEVPYQTVPCTSLTHAMPVHVTDKRLKIYVVAGLMQQTPEDVMRGEETQIAGLLTTDPAFSGSVCTPGTHSKWVQVQDGRITEFHTAMTGELFALLQEQSVLRYCVGKWDEQRFCTALQHSYRQPDRLLLSLFGIRAQYLINESASGESEVSGMLIGSELAAMRAFWQQQPVVIVGASKLARLYALGLRTLGASCQELQASQLTLNGLRLTYQTIFHA